MFKIILKVCYKNRLKQLIDRKFSSVYIYFREKNACNINNIITCNLDSRTLRLAFDPDG